MLGVRVGIFDTALEAQIIRHDQLCTRGAKLKEYNTRSSVIKTVRLYSERELPPIIGIYSYVDCAEGDLVKLRACAGTVLG